MADSLAEQLLLVALDPINGKVSARPALALPYALAGAVVMDLLLGHGSRLVDGKVQAGPDTGDPVLDDALRRIRDDSKPRDVKHWVKKLAGRSSNLQGSLLERLVDGHVLEERDSRVLGFRLKRYSLVDSAERDRVLTSIREALVLDAPADARTGALVALVSAAGLLDRAMARDERASAKRRAREIAKDDPAGRAVYSAVQEVEAAVMSGVIAAIAASSVTSSGHGH